MRLILRSLLLLVAPVAAQQISLEPVGDEAFAVMERQFAYDPAPLSPRMDTLQQTTNGTQYRLVYTGARARRVTGYVELPLHFDPPFPVVVLIHDLGRSKQTWWSLTSTTEGKLKDRLLGEGYAVVGLDLPVHGDRVADGDFASPVTLLDPGRDAALRDFFVDAVVDHRRLLDLLESRADIDEGRVALLGYGLGATTAAAVTALDARAATVVACVPPTVHDRLSLLALQNYLPRMRASLFLLMATNSVSSDAGDGEALHALALMQEKELKVYTSDDRLPIWYAGDVISWLGARLP